MYNQELKERYRKEKESYTTVSSHYFSSLFRRTEPFEEQLEKDASNFTTYEIINMYKTLAIMSLDTIITMNSNLSMYTQWCIQENLVNDFQNHYLEISRDMMASFVNKFAMDKKVVSRKQILDWCQQLPNPSDSFCLLGLFEGIRGGGYLELALAKLEDFHDDIFVAYNGREIKVSPILIEYARLSNETLDYQSISHNMSKEVVLIDNGRIIKDYPNVRRFESLPVLRRRTQSRLARIFDYMGILEYMNGNDIRMSGVIEMINSRCKELGISGKDYIYGIGIEEIKKQYDLNIVPSTFMDKFGEYLV